LSKGLDLLNASDRPLKIYSNWSPTLFPVQSLPNNVDNAYCIVKYAYNGRISVQESTSPSPLNIIGYKSNHRTVNSVVIYFMKINSATIFFVYSEFRRTWRRGPHYRDFRSSCNPAQHQDHAHALCVLYI